MELPCESLRYPEDRRPASCKFVELHVLFVPDDQWNVKLNKVPAEAIESFISAGFIRVYPDTNLKTLRSELGALLGTDRSDNKFSFLKCVGRSLALVKSKQERDLKVKTFAPPYAPQPELYLLSVAEGDDSVCSRPLTPDTGSSSQDRPAFYHPPKSCSLPTGTKETVKFPLIPRCSHQPPPTPSLEEEEDEEEEEEEEEEESYNSSEGEGDEEEEALSPNNSEWADQERCPRKSKHQRPKQPVSLNKVLQRRDADPARGKEETSRKSQEDRDSGFSLTDGFGKPKDAQKLKSVGSKPSGMTESPAALSQPVHRPPTPPGQDLATVTIKTAAPSVFQATKEELIEEIKLVREERKRLEWTRQELLRKGKDLLAQNRHRRNQARDSWKKRYFETKKATAPLEENLKNLRQDLETFYNKLLHQLQARDNRGKPRRQGRSSIKNELIIQIMTEIHEIDNLKRKVEDAKMKLVTEIKLRKQAATELRALKAELAQKKSQSGHLVSSTASFGFGFTKRDRPQAQNTSV